MTQMNLPMKQKQNHGHREQTGGCQVLGKLKWRKPSEAGEQAFDMLLICLDTAWIPCLHASIVSQAAPQIRKGVGLGILEPLEALPAPWVLMKCYDSQG